MSRTLGVPLALLAVVLTGCSSPPPSDAAAAAALTGVWTSEGYGFVLAGAGDSLRWYEATETTCVPATVLTRRDERPEGVEATYADDDGRILVKPGTDDAVKRLRVDGSASDVVVRRIDRLPAPCVTPTADTPIDNFEVFAQTWSEHYILFDKKGVDWPAVVAAARATVTPRTTPEALFGIMQSMIAPLHDAHTFIAAPSIGKTFRTMREGTDRVATHGLEGFREQDMPALLAVTNRRLRSPIRRFCNDQLHYSALDDSTGYLRILSESEYVKDAGFAEGLVALEAALDTIFTDASLKGVVIDVRINFGGADPYGLALASRLTATPYVAYSKEARLDPRDRTKWTPGQPSEVRPGQRPGFRGPVVELIGPLTISAGETTTQALMGRRPRVLRIGESTQGVFSDVLGRHLPNGWRFGLPNEVFRTLDGKTFDGPGIPPDLEVPVFADADIRANRDPALDRALLELYRPR